MTDERTLELLSAAADGELSADDRPKLDRLLETSAEAREFKAELEQLDSLLRDIPDLEPPGSLHSHIMAQLEPPAASSKPSVIKPSVMEWLRPLIAGTGLRYALAGAAGAVLAALFIGGQSALPVTGDNADLAGTMAPHGSSVDADIIDSFEFHDIAAGSVVQLALDNGTAFLDIQFDADAPLELSVDMSGTGLWPDTVAQIDGRFESITISNQALQVRSLGRQRLSIMLDRVDDAVLAGEAKITLEFSSEGKLLRQGSLRATW